MRATGRPRFVTTNGCRLSATSSSSAKHLALKTTAATDLVLDDAALMWSSLTGPDGVVKASQSFKPRAVHGAVHNTVEGTKLGVPTKVAPSEVKLSAATVPFASSKR